jgi:ferrous iron transport protein A
VRLSELSRFQTAVVEQVEAIGATDNIAQRLGVIGFVPGETVRITATGPVGSDPLLVQVGFTRFALRRSEAARVIISLVQS